MNRYRYKVSLLMLRRLIVGAGLSLLALSIFLHYRIDARFDSRAPPVATSAASNGIMRIKKFGIEETFIVRAFDIRGDGERICGSCKLRLN
jgi:hypothetical protein